MNYAKGANHVKYSKHAKYVKQFSTLCVTARLNTALPLEVFRMTQFIDVPHISLSCSCLFPKGFLPPTLTSLLFHVQLHVHTSCIIASTILYKYRGWASGRFPLYQLSWLLDLMFTLSELCHHSTHSI